MSDTTSKSQVGGQITTSNSHNVVDDMPNIHPAVSALPTASAIYRGRSVYVPGNGTTTPDTFYICLMGSTGAYSWKSIITG